MKGNYSNIPVIAINKLTGETKRYNSQYEASLQGFDTCKIGEACRNKRFSHRGYFWIYEKDFNENSYSECVEANIAHRKTRKAKPSNVKICTKCSVEKELSFFGKCRGGKYGVDSICGKCRTKMFAHRRNTNLMTKITFNLRVRLNHALKIKNWKKTSKFSQYIGCDRKTLIRHLESQFTPEMTWENYGSYWEIDHIIPYYTARNEHDAIKLSHYKNLRPLTVTDNRSRKRE